jgi:hypothetical protein
MSSPIIPTAEPAASEARARPRRVCTAEQRADYLARFPPSGLTQAQFCRECGLSESTFSQWRHAARASAERRSTQFAEVQMSTPPSAATAATLRLHFPGGATLETSATTDAAWRGLGLLLKSFQPEQT